MRVCTGSLILIAVLLAVAPAQAQPACRVGDADLDVPAGATRVLGRAYGSPVGDVDNAAGSASIAVGTAVGDGDDVQAGDLLLVVQMQGAAINTGSEGNGGPYGDGAGGLDRAGVVENADLVAGRYEVVLARSGVVAGRIEVQGEGAGGGLVSRYLNRDVVDAAGGVRRGVARYQVVVIQRFHDASVAGTVVPPPWDGRAGGVLAVDVSGTLTFAGGALDASARGFRGGMYAQLDDNDGLVNDNTVRSRGEGIVGAPRNLYVRPDIPGAGVDDRDELTHRQSSALGVPGAEQGLGAPGNGGGR